MKRLLVLASLLLVPFGARAATVGFTPGSPGLAYYIPCTSPSTTYCPSSVLMDSTGTEKGTTGNPVIVNVTGVTTQPVSGALASFVDGSIATIGTEADSAYAGSGSTTVIGALKGLYTLTNNALLPSGTLIPGTAPAQGIAVLQQYNSVAPSPGNGQTLALQSDASGNLKVNVAGGSAGNAAASATASPVPSNGSYTAGNVGGTLRGITASNPSGVVFSLNTDITSVNGATVNVGTGGSGSGTQRVTVASDSSIILAAGSAKFGQAAVDQSTPGTTNAVSLAYINSTATSAGNGTSGAGVQRVVIASDNAAIAGFGVGATAQTVPVNAVYGGVNVGGNLTGLVGDPCQVNAHTYTPVNIASATTTVLQTGTAAKKTYVCHIFLFAAAANNVALVQGTTGTTCATSTLGMMGGATAAAGINLSGSQGWVEGSGANAVAATTVNQNDVCLITSGAAQVSGVMVTAQQ